MMEEESSERMFRIIHLSNRKKNKSVSSFSCLQTYYTRSEAVQKVAKTIIDNGALALQAKKHLDEYGEGDSVELPLLGMGYKSRKRGTATVRSE